MKLLILLTTVASILSKYYDNYAARDNCLPHKTCYYSNPKDFIFYVARGLDLDSLSIDSSLDTRLNFNYKLCMNKMFLCGYVPFKNTYNFPSPSFGVTVGIGHDLFNFSNYVLGEMNISEGLINKLKPFTFFTGRGAYERILLFDLLLTEEEVNELYSKNMEYTYKRMVEEIKRSSQEAEQWFTRRDDNFQKAVLSIYSYFDSFSQISAIKSAIIDMDVEAVKKAFFKEDYKLKYDNPYLRRFAEKLLLNSLNVDYAGNTALTVFIDSRLSKEKLDLIRNVSESIYLKNISILDLSHSKLKVVTYDGKSLFLNKDFNDIIISWNQEQGKSMTLEIAIDVEIAELQQLNKDNYFGTILLFSTDNFNNITVAQVPNIYIIPVSFGTQPIDNLLSLTDGRMYNIIKVTNSPKDPETFRRSLLPYIYLHHLEIKALPENNGVLERSNYVRDHDNPIYYKVSKRSGSYLKVLVESTKPDYALQIFVDYSNPFPSKHLFLYSHLSSDSTTRELIVDDKTATDENKEVYLAIYGTDCSYKISFSECDPRFCHHRSKGSSMISTLFITFMTSLTLLYGSAVFFYFYFISKKKEIETFKADENQNKIVELEVKENNQQVEEVQLEKEIQLEKELEDVKEEEHGLDWKLEEIGEIKGDEPEEIVEAEEIPELGEHSEAESKEVTDEENNADK